MNDFEIETTQAPSHGDASGAQATLAEQEGMTHEMGDAIACLAEAELEAGRAEIARAILEGLVVMNHEDAGAWALLSAAHRRLGQPLAARFCAEVAVKLAPADGWVRLTRAESLLALPEERERAREELAALATDAEVGGRARALLGGLGQPVGLPRAESLLALPERERAREEPGAPATGADGEGRARTLLGGLGQWVRLSRAESLLALPNGRERAREELGALATDADVGGRARALLGGLGQ